MSMLIRRRASHPEDRQWKLFEGSWKTLLRPGSGKVRTVASNIVECCMLTMAARLADI